MLIAARLGGKGWGKEIGVNRKIAGSFRVDTWDNKSCWLVRKMQFSLFSVPLPAGCFARSAKGGKVVLIVPVAEALALPVGVGASLRAAGCSVVRSQIADYRGQFVAALVVAPPEIKEFLLSLPQPPAGGSLGVAACVVW